MKKVLLVIFIILSSSQHLQAAKITRVILASNNNSEYLEFWPIVSKLWSKLLGARPTLAFIGPSDVKIDQTYGDVVYIDPIEGISTALQAQTIRLLLPCLFPDDFCLISDLDMIPLQGEYFKKPVANLPKDKFVVYRNAAYGPGSTEYPMCYNAALGSTFQDIFQVDTIEQMQRLMIEWNSAGLGWTTDEKMLKKYLNGWRKFGSHCVLLGHRVGPRICRSRNMCFNPKQLKSNVYIDMHSVRPYSKHKYLIDKILSLAKLD